MFKGKYAIVLTVLLLMQGGFYYAVALRDEAIPLVAPLSAFPTAVGPWRMYKDVKIEQEILDILKADDTLNRIYVRPSDGNGRPTSSSRSSRRSVPARRRTRPRTACREPVGSRSNPPRLTITVPGRAEPLVINRYLMARGDEKSVMLYWYQSHDRIIAGEFAAKFWLIADSIRYHRSDSSLVKVVVPVRRWRYRWRHERAVEFVQAVFPAVCAATADLVAMATLFAGTSGLRMRPGSQVSIRPSWPRSSFSTTTPSV